MNSENFYFNIASKTDLGKKISRMYLIGNISKEEYTDKIRNIADKIKADDAFVESLNIESIKNNLDACVNLFEIVDASDIAGRARNRDLLDKIIAYYERFNIAPDPLWSDDKHIFQDMGYVKVGFDIASLCNSKEEYLKLKDDEERIRAFFYQPIPWYYNIPHWVGYTTVVIGFAVIGWLMYINI